MPVGLPGAFGSITRSGEPNAQSSVLPSAWTVPGFGTQVQIYRGVDENNIGTYAFEAANTTGLFGGTARDLVVVFYKQVAYGAYALQPFLRFTLHSGDVCYVSAKGIVNKVNGREPDDLWGEYEILNEPRVKLQVNAYWLVAQPTDGGVEFQYFGRRID